MHPVPPIVDTRKIFATRPVKKRLPWRRRQQITLLANRWLEAGSASMRDAIKEVVLKLCERDGWRVALLVMAEISKTNEGSARWFAEYMQ